jgi:hypothetical protein
MNSTSFGDFMNPGEFNQKTIKVDLFVKVNHVYPRRNCIEKTLEHSRRQPTTTETERLPCGAGRRHLQAGWPMGPIGQPLLAMSVSHGVKDQIYAVAQGRFDPTVQIWRCPLYIAAPTPLLEAILKS